jgi:hypothetical protein
MTFHWVCGGAAAVCSLYPAWLYSGNRIARAPGQGLARLRDRPASHQASHDPAPVLTATAAPTIAPSAPAPRPRPLAEPAPAPTE